MYVGDHARRSRWRKRVAANLIEGAVEGRGGEKEKTTVNRNERS